MQNQLVGRGDLVGIDAVVLFLGHGNGPQHQWMRYLHGCGMRPQVIVQPVKMVASIATIHGCGRVFIHWSRSNRVSGILPSPWIRPLASFTQ
jgi:hypothetical protein